MQKFERLPEGVVTGWASEDVFAEKGRVFPHHFHELEEWLEVLEGNIAFFSAGDSDDSPSFPLGPGQALTIPRGEVHRVVVGARDVTYRMWTPIKAPSKFAKEIDPDLWQLIRDNLEIPAKENVWDVRNKNEPIEVQRKMDEYYFLEGLLDDGLIFRAGNGDEFDKSRYLARRTGSDKRVSPGSLRILDRRDASILLLTLVHTGDTRLSFANLRLFVKDRSERWRCRVWLNYPDIASH
jgi:hypothetical protein